MPEGPEIKLLSEFLRKKIIGKQMTNIISISKQKVKWGRSCTVLDVGCKGKLIWIEFEDFVLHIVLLINGWIYDKKEPDIKYILVFDSNLKIYITDPRKLCKIIRMDYDQHEDILHKKLGVDILTAHFTLDAFFDLVYNYSINICAFLMDQKIMSGVGNYIKNEVLYLAKISPRRKTDDLTDNEIEDLFCQIKFVSFSNLIEQMIDYGLQIPSSIKKLEPKYLEVPYQFKVYKMDFDPNGFKVKTEIIAGRNTYYVPKIQHQVPN